jgi:transcriptional regulator with XRE-family HTH domain
MEIDDEFAKALARVLYALRTEKGLSQEQLAVKSKMTRTAIASYEKELRNPTVRVVYRIAKALDMKTSKLISMVEAVEENR